MRHVEDLGPLWSLAPLDLLLGPEPSALGHELMVSQMPSITWSDLDTPRRVFQLVRELDLQASVARRPAGKT